MATGKTAAEDTDPTHIIRFLGMMTNSEIARKITQKGIPEGMTLGQAFTRAIELEAGYQLSEGVSLARPPEIMQVQQIEELDEIAALQRRLKDVVCGDVEKKDTYIEIVLIDMETCTMMSMMILMNMQERVNKLLE